LESTGNGSKYRNKAKKINKINDFIKLICFWIDFPGWKIVKNKYEKENKTYHYLQTIKPDSALTYKKILSKVTIKGGKQRYTEAKLVQLLEEKGIGRPSTFSALVDKIQERGYVKKDDVKGKTIACSDFELENGEIFEIENNREFGNEKNKLIIQPLGIIVIEFLDKHFHELFDYSYTGKMEETLDKIAKGEIECWYELCASCNDHIDKLVGDIQLDCASRVSFKIDQNNTYIVGKHGPVIKCVENVDGKDVVAFKSVKNDIDMKKLEKGLYKLEDLIEDTMKLNSSADVGEEPKTETQLETETRSETMKESTKNTTKNTPNILGQFQGHDVVIKKGKFGIYVTWGENSKTLKELGNRPIENVTFQEIKCYLEEGSKIIRSIGLNTSIRKGPKGDYIFYKTPKMKKPAFYSLIGFVRDTQEDYKICDSDILESWLCEKYGI
jgi:DNA topoisomerase-1